MAKLRKYFLEKQEKNEFFLVLSISTYPPSVGIGSNRSLCVAVAAFRTLLSFDVSSVCNIYYYILNIYTFRINIINDNVLLYYSIVGGCWVVGVLP